jgi:anti-sigma B factor antagonist
MVASALSPVAATPNHLAALSVSREGDRTVIWLDGEHDIATLLPLQDTLANAISADGADVVVDLSGVTFIDATTIGELIRGRNTLRHQSRSLALRSPSRQAGRLLELCGLTDLVD